jgi:Protein of unknown function (DUF2911)
MRVPAFLSVILAAVVVSLDAQTVPEVKLPPSPQGQASVQVGGRWEKTPTGGQRYVDGKWIVVDYGRPLLRGRANIFGAGADYGKTISDGSPVWRVGANDTTRLTTQAPLAIGGKTIAPGVYNVFAELKAGAWTLVLSTQPRQPKYDPNDKVLLYGSYNYDPKFDLVRVPMRMMPLDISIEQLTIGFADARTDGGTLFIAWGKTMGAVDFKATN